MAIKPINVVITGFDRASGVFGSLSKKANTFGKSIEGIGRVSGKLGLGIAGVGIGAAFATGMSSIPGQILKMEHGLQALGNIGGLTKTQINSIGKELKTVSKETNQFQDDLLGGLNTLVAKGMDPSTAMAFLNPIGKAATAAQADVNDLANTTFTVYDNMAVPVNRLGKALDVMAAAGKEGSFELKDMAREFPGLTASAKGLGVQGVAGVAKLGAALQISMKGAADTSEAANNFQNFLTKITSRDTRKRYMAAGVDLKEVLNKALSEGKDPIEEILNITKHKTGGDPFKLSLLFDDMQVLKFVKAMSQNMDEYRRIRDESAKADGVNERDFQRMMTTNLELWKQLKVTMQSMDFKPVAQGITMLNKGLMWLNEGNGENARLAIIGITGAIAVGGGLMALKVLASTLMDISTVMGFIAARSAGTAAGLKAVTAATAASTAAGTGAGIAGGAGAGTAAGAAGGGVAAAGALAIPGLLLFGAYRAFKDGMREGARQFADNQGGINQTQVNTGFGGVLPTFSSVPKGMSNPEAVRAAGGRGPQATVGGEIFIKIDAPQGTKVATRSRGVDLRPELGRAFP